MNSRSRIARYMQQHQRATRPQLAAALGVSLVSINTAVAALEKGGILKRGATIPSGGGRPVTEYLFNPGHASVALFTAAPESHCTRVRFELLDLQGEIQETTEARFAQLHAESLDEWLDAAARHHKLQRICLSMGMGGELILHLQQRYTCSVQEISIAETLLNEQQETLAILLLRGQRPQAAMLRHGKVTRYPLLHLLPLPAEWEALDYADHTLVEEMLARLLQLLTCTLSPTRIALHADFWTDRLISRVNYNLGTKLRGIGTLPQLRFISVLPDTLADKLRKHAALY